MLSFSDKDRIEMLQSLPRQVGGMHPAAYRVDASCAKGIRQLICAGGLLRHEGHADHVVSAAPVDFLRLLIDISNLVKIRRSHGRYGQKRRVGTGHQLLQRIDIHQICINTSGFVHFLLPAHFHSLGRNQRNIHGYDHSFLAEAGNRPFPTFWKQHRGLRAKMQNQG